MRITNRYNLPEPLVEAVENDPYDKGESDITVTTLINPPQVTYLKKIYNEELTEDASDRIWALLGSSVHGILERATSSEKKARAGVLVEKRLYSTIETANFALTGGSETTTSKLKIGGQLDHYDNGVLTDYKVTSVWAIKAQLDGEAKPEWEAQMNLLAWLLDANGYDVHTLQILAIARDWQERKGGSSGYPGRAELLEIKRWDKPRLMEHLMKTVGDHLASPPRECTELERWASEDTYAVKKKGRVRALRVLPSHEAAMKWLEASGKPRTGLKIEYRHGGKWKRCDKYCSVNQFCEQYKGRLVEENGAI